MKLRELFERMRPMFVGKATPEETAQAIYGDEADGIYGRRLALYENSKSGRARELRLAFPGCAAVLGDRWDDLAYEFFVRHPVGRYDWLPAGDHFAAYLAELADRPAWLPELAAFEWAMHRAPITEAASTTGPLRIATGVSLHRFTHDLARWLRHRDPAKPPTPARCAVVLYTLPDGDARFLTLEDYQLVMLEQLAAGTFDPATVPASEPAIDRALHVLRNRGIVLGELEMESPPAAVATLGRDLAMRVQLVPGSRLTWIDNTLVLGSPNSTEVIASDDPSFVAIAATVALPCSISEAIASLPELPPSMVVETLDVLLEAKLLIPATATTTESRVSIALQRPAPPDALASLLARELPGYLQLVPLRERGVTSIYVSARLANAGDTPLAEIAAQAGRIADALIAEAQQRGLVLRRVEETLSLAVWPEPVFATLRYEPEPQ